MRFLRVPCLLNVSKRYFKTDARIMKYLNVAEKNDAAKNISAILSRGTASRREGFSPYNKIYVFDAQVFGEQATMVMTSVSGHLLAYEFAANFKNWQSCNPVTLFDAPVLKMCPKDYQKIKKTLEREVTSCEGLIIWTDCDREGENIGFEIIKVCTDVKPQLRIYRAKFSEITGPSIFRALNTLGQPNRNISDAVDVRSEMDLRTGAAFTRLQTLRLQKVFPQKLADKLISYGSCQFPTLGFVVDRYQAIEEFIPEPFWRIKMNHTVKDLTTDFSWQRDRLFNKNSCEAILDVCKENPQATVESVESKEKSKWRPLPLDTVEMEKSASKKLKINAKDAMKIAEKLYSQGFISYPRTETNIFPKELNLANLVEQQREDARWGPFAQRIINEGGPNPRQGKKSDQAHPPIHPTRYAPNLTGNELRLYEFIVRHFLACVHKDAKGFETTVTVDIAGEKFTAKGLIILERNYLDVYIYEKWNAKEINNYNRGDTFMPTILDIVESSTAPPKLLTEADLITLMEKHGIGTDATHAEHIDKIKSREYVGLLENMYFVPGNLGMGLVEGYNNIGLEVSLAKPILRADFEKDLKLICDGHKDPQVVLQEQIAKYREVFRSVMDKMNLIDDSLANRLNDRPLDFQDNNLGGNPDNFRPVLKCPKCGNDMVVRSAKESNKKYIGCTGFPDCKNSIWLPQSVESIQVLPDHCQNCGTNVKKLKIKFKQNPFPGEPNPNVLCIGGCDLDVLEVFGVNVSAVVPVQMPTNQAVPNRPNANQTASNRPNANQMVLNRPNANQTASNRPNANQMVLNRPNANVPRNNLTNNNRDTNGSPNLSNQTNPTRANSWISNDVARPANRPSLDLMPGPSGSGRTSRGDATNLGDDIVCSCNAEANLLTVRKDGPNKGRQFYKCASNTCDFFLWAPEDNSRAFDTTRTTIGRGATVTCKCPQPAALKKVSKAGPNTGRQFYSCPKPIGEGCNFFKWADEATEGGANDGTDDDWGGGQGNNSRWTGKALRGKKGAASTRAAPYKVPTTRAKSKCGICKEEGHTRNRCPNRD